MESLFTRYFEQLFFKMQYLKSKYQTTITDWHLKNNMRLSTTQIEPNNEHHYIVPDLKLIKICLHLYS